VTVQFKVAQLPTLATVFAGAVTIAWITAFNRVNQSITIQEEHITERFEPNTVLWAFHTIQSSSYLLTLPWSSWPSRLYLNRLIELSSMIFVEIDDQLKSYFMYVYN